MKGSKALPHGPTGEKEAHNPAGTDTAVPVYMWEVCDAEDFINVWLPQMESGDLAPTEAPIAYYSDVNKARYVSDEERRALIVNPMATANLRRR